MCCPKGMTYQIKGSGCPKTCLYPEGDPHCPAVFVEGCQCDEGYVQNVSENGDVVCIKATECEVCEVNGRRLQVGETIKYNCREW